MLSILMKSYQSRSGKKSGVIAYAASTDSITVQFEDGEVYRYSYRSAGKAVVEEMKALADAQQGLATFISRHRPEFEK